MAGQRGRRVLLGLSLVALVVAGGVGALIAVGGSDAMPWRDLQADPHTDPQADPERDLTCRPGGQRPDRELVALARVEGGELGPMCFGGRQGIIAAWSVIAAVTPDEYRRDIEWLGLIDEDSDILAYTTPVGEVGEPFLLAFHVDLELGSDLFTLTVAHELAHVVTSLATQIDTSPGPCSTFVSYGACFAGDALVMDWIEAFWSDEDLAAVAAPDDPQVDHGEQRCRLDAGLLGPYAAAHPEEDLAEAFSAFVFDVEVREAVRPRLDFFEEVPAAVAFRDRARAKAGPMVSDVFDPCG